MTSLCLWRFSGSLQVHARAYGLSMLCGQQMSWGRGSAGGVAQVTCGECRDRLGHPTEQLTARATAAPGHGTRKPKGLETGGGR
jgi:hypothetical protein